jgi:hypothetical protein
MQREAQRPESCRILTTCASKDVLCKLQGRMFCSERIRLRHIHGSELLILAIM